MNTRKLLKTKMRREPFRRFTIKLNSGCQIHIDENCEIDFPAQTRGHGPYRGLRIPQIQDQRNRAAGRNGLGKDRIRVKSEPLIKRGPLRVWDPKVSEFEKKPRLDLEPGAKASGMFDRDRAFASQNPGGNGMIDPENFA
jgi:hypothetical protein